MTAKKINRYLVFGFIGGLILSGFMLNYAANWLTESSVELTSLRTEVAQLDKKRADLDIASQVLSDQQVSIETLEKVVPTEKDQARVIKELYAIAAQAGISIESVGFPASTLGSEAPKPAPTTTTDPAQTQNSQDTSQQTTQKAPTSISQATPVKDIPGLQSIEITLGTLNSTSLPVNSGVRYSEMISFIRLVEHNQRTMQIKSIGITQRTPINGEAVFNLDIALTIYVRG